MEKNIKIVLTIIIAIVLVIISILIGILFINDYDNNSSKYTIISTSFPGYDFARAITKGSDVEVKMLLKPGSETHSYEPTPQDIKNIRNSDIFIFVGGDSDEWIKDIISDIDLSKTKIIKLMDIVDNVEEEVVPGMEEHEEDDEEEIEYDEHVWTSPKNAIEIVNYIKEKVIEMDNENKELYESNSLNYINEINEIDLNIRNIVRESTRKEIIFGDRFPIRYFTEEYGLTYYAAFPGCSDQTEASAKTISFLINKVKEDNIPVVFHIELSNGKIAETISKETGAKVLEFKTAHNISQIDFNNGVTYVDIMRLNLDVLKEALN